MGHVFMAYLRKGYLGVFDLISFLYPAGSRWASFVFMMLMSCCMGRDLYALKNPYPYSESIYATSLICADESPLVDPPNFTIRFANPQFNCSTSEYCVDVQLQSDIPDQQLFGINVRFFYADNTLELIDFRDFQGGYGPVAPNPPTVLTSPPSFGYDYFHLGTPGNGAADWVNGAVQLVDYGQPPLYISTTDWTKVFQICFAVDDPDPDSTQFCPSLIWDLEQNPADGGFLSGDEGVVMTATTGVPGESTPVFEHVAQFNWQYTGSGGAPPFGEPIETDCIPFSCGMNITCPADVTVSCGSSTLPAATGYAIAEDNCPGSPVLSYTDTILQGICGNTLAISRTWSALDSCGNMNSCTQTISIADNGSICGAVFDDTGLSIGNVEIQLYADVNANQWLDPADSLLMITNTNVGDGTYCFIGVAPCPYIVVEDQPVGYGSMSDLDISPDPDGDDSVDGPDNEIPVMVAACELDSGNLFTDIICPGIFPMLPPDSICDGQTITFSAEAMNPGAVTYTWNFGSGSAPGTAMGLGPHTVTYMTTPENQNMGALVQLTLSKEGCPDTTAQVTAIDINPYPDATINASAEPGCYYSERIFVPLHAEIPGATYVWNFGADAVPSMAVGYGPHTVYYNAPGQKTVSLLVMPGEPGAQCPDSATITFQIQTCPSQIFGLVRSVTNQPIMNVNVRLYADVDTNGIADNGTIIRSVFTNSAGSFSMGSLTPGSYVLVEMQPSGWYSWSDGDLTDDGDWVPNVDTLDNLIPVTLTPSELDAANFYIEAPISGSITGAVFDDADGDQMPDPEEGLDVVVLSLFTDADTDGVADGPDPILSTSSLSDGTFAFPDVPVGNYVLVESQPAEYTSIKEYDASDDQDQVPNSNMVNDTLPVTIINTESDEHNYFVEQPFCNLLITNTNDSGSGSLRDVLECASDGDTIRFSPGLEGATIQITTVRLLLEKNITLYSECVPRVTVASDISGLFDVASGHTVKIINLNMISGLAGNGGAVFNNYGLLHLEDILMYRNPNLPVGEYLIQNHTSAQLWIEGECQMFSN